MKDLIVVPALTVVNVFRSPITFEKLLAWWRQLEFLSYNRLQYLIFAGYMLIDKKNHDKLYLVTAFAALIFELDNYIDRTEQVKADFPTVLESEKFRNLFDALFVDLSEPAKIRLRESLRGFLVHDEAARTSKTAAEYLDHARVSIGLPPLALLYAVLSGEEAPSQLVDQAGEIIRILSDLSTKTKDKSENGGNNIVYLLGEDNARLLLRTKVLEFEAVPLSSNTDLFLGRLINVCKKFYSKDKDFEA